MTDEQIKNLTLDEVNSFVNNLMSLMDMGYCITSSGEVRKQTKDDASSGEEFWAIEYNLDEE